MNHSAEIAALKARVATLEAQLNAATKAPRAEEPDSALIDGIPRDANGVVIPDPEAPGYEARMAAQREGQVRRDQEYRERSERGLPHGQFRDAFGMVRDADGNRVPLANVDAASAAQNEAEPQ